jgi:catechol 2,3-dioxygenase-like lactoylglutathione lyase family enzyme
MQRISHIGIGVSDLDRALEFYCGVLGLTVSLRITENPTHWDAERAAFRRESAYLRWSDESVAFIVLSKNESRRARATSPLDISDVGIHHFSFTVDDLGAAFDRIKASGATIVKEPYETTGEAFGLPPAQRILTCLFRDPDGTVLQLDEFLD